MFGGSDRSALRGCSLRTPFLLNYDQLKGVGVTEVKSENVINRLTSKATHRQIERVIAGSRFGSTSFTTCPTPKRWKRTFCFCPRP